VPTLIMTKGLPASGKSTWSKEQVINGKGQIKRVNKDDLRGMIDSGKWSGANEKDILAVRDLIIRHYLTRGFSVIVDDTNLSPLHEKVLADIAQGFEVPLEVKSFLHIPIMECIKRDLHREDSVGERVIRRMFNQYLRPKTIYAPSDKPAAIICDIDGTAAHMTDRSPYDYSRVFEDIPDPAVRELLYHYYVGRDPNDEQHATTIIMLSGRPESARADTEQWLATHNFKYDYLHMRPDGDNREDSIVKQELFEKHIAQRYNVLFVLDDRNRVVDMWRSLGLKCLQVAEGDF
jgi:predicted kinase